MRLAVPTGLEPVTFGLGKLPAAVVWCLTKLHQLFPAQSSARLYVMTWIGWSRIPPINQIILYLDTPGGQALGVEELVSDIAKAAARKDITAYVDGLCASAGFWIASPATRIIATRSAEVGSLGVFILHADFSRALDQAGITPTFVVARIYRRMR